MIAHVLGVHSLGRNLPLQPWNSMWLSMIALEPSVCAIFFYFIFYKVIMFLFDLLGIFFQTFFLIFISMILS
jgi:hypothetical protein